MTAEIGVLNKEAVALAADSAVTLSNADGQKIFMSANKIFALSKYYPIGIMVYGNATFMGVPWETIIKFFRNYLGQIQYNTIEEYVIHFFEFLRKNQLLFPTIEQTNFVTSAINGYFQKIKFDIEEKVKNKININDSITENEIKKYIKESIDKNHKIWTIAEILKTVPDDFIEKFGKMYSEKIAIIRNKVFEKLPINPSYIKKLNEIAVNLFIKFPSGIFCSGISGVVIAGFGKNEIYPSLISFEIEGIVNNYLKYRETNKINISSKNTSSIIPFAQSEVVATFVEGVDPNYQREISIGLKKIFDKYPEILINSFENIDEQKKTQHIIELRKINNELLKGFFDNLQQYKNASYINPILKVVNILPKSELAAMAESFINITSLKRKVSMSAETVGGPVDVAVISKGDGFIWIKRKHYFKPDLNQQFNANYYREDSKNGTKKNGK
ncbi:hypothetical protein JXQ31_11945 [candidate division KSB1 bacterium]|nr:hypothetical protein [candidate division KSB1 bacterium]